MPFDLEEVRKFLRSEFDLNVADDDPILASYMLGQLSLVHMKPEFRELAATVAAGVITNSNKIMEKSHGSMVEIADAITSMKSAMDATVQAAEKAQRLNDMLDAKLAALDEKIAAFDERITQSDILAKDMTKSARTSNQAVVALTSGLLKIQPRSIWKRDRPT